MNMNIQTREYTARSGKLQYKPSLGLLESLDLDGRGFCLSCGDTETAAEPDARRYNCECCGAPKVYGASELALMGLYFEE